MPKTTKKTKTWKDIAESSKSKKPTLTLYMRLKRAFLYIKYLGIILILAAIGYGGYFLYKSDIIDRYFYNDSQKIKNFIFKKDKNITGEWLWKYSELNTSMPLDSIDIFKLKTSIESLNQVESVKIEKIYPNSLKIELEEKDYIAKTYRDGKLLIMSSKGHFYEPICFSEESLVKLPELTELEIKTKDGKYLPFSKANKIQELIFTATLADGIDFENWREINLKKANYLVEPLIEIYTLDGMKIVFSFEDLENQFLKLKSTLAFSKKNSLELAEIDLSLKDRADVKPRKEQK